MKSSFFFFGAVVSLQTLVVHTTECHVIYGIWGLHSLDIWIFGECSPRIQPSGIGNDAMSPGLAEPIEVGNPMENKDFVLLGNGFALICNVVSIDEERAF